jgi:hypothetical protein
MERTTEAFGSGICAMTAEASFWKKILKLEEEHVKNNTVAASSSEDRQDQ